MQPEHAHLDMNYSIPYEPRVSHETHIKEVALKAMEKIPGAKEVIEKRFDKSAWKMPYTLPAKNHINQAYHLGW